MGYVLIEIQFSFFGGNNSADFIDPFGQCSVKVLSCFCVHSFQLLRILQTKSELLILNSSIRFVASLSGCMS